MKTAGILVYLISLGLACPASEIKTSIQPPEESFDDLMKALDVITNEPKKAPTPLRQTEIEKWIKQLGDASFRKREAAEALLKTVKEKELTVLENHLGVKDPEVRVRLKTIIQSFKIKRRQSTHQYVDDPFHFDDPDDIFNWDP